MTMKEIEKLREKVEKDPNSKLYVPLAEEYRKEGRLDEAIEVLRKGIERQPGYMSARVSLGKIYFEKGQMNEARGEFESVIKSIPDNLFAHKKLAEIYRGTNEKALAIKAYRMFLKLNPMDEEALNNLRELEGTSAEQPLEKQKEPVAPSAESPFQSMVVEQTTHDQPILAATKLEGPAESVEELDAFKESLFGLHAETEEEIQEDILDVDEEVRAEVVELPEEAEEEWSLGDVESIPVSAADEGAITEVEEIPEEADEEWSFGDVESIPASEAEQEESMAVEELPEEADEELSFGDIADCWQLRAGSSGRAGKKSENILAQN